MSSQPSCPLSWRWVWPVLGVAPGPRTRGRRLPLKRLWRWTTAGGGGCLVSATAVLGEALEPASQGDAQNQPPVLLPWQWSGGPSLGGDTALAGEALQGQTRAYTQPDAMGFWISDQRLLIGAGRYG